MSCFGQQATCGLYFHFSVGYPKSWKGPSKTDSNILVMCEAGCAEEGRVRAMQKDGSMKGFDPG